MQNKAVSIGEVKRKISEFVNRVAYGGERTILTSRDMPKPCWSALRTTNVFKNRSRLRTASTGQTGYAAPTKVSQRILQERGGQPLEVDQAVQAAKEELETR